MLAFGESSPELTCAARIHVRTRGGANDPKTRTRQMNELLNSRPCVWINDRVHLPTESSADVSATQSELISSVTAVRAAHGKIARHLHTAARPPGHERESTELLIRTLPFQHIQLARRIRGHRA
ncbi:unnamed protein product [Pleuronectes platessa]|uniref:Uncharacterized protein n=1 Tax=Pleuronectes platessa TaxID=8262 RepID=A0A9N7V2Q2_PLEPL|nr:unnamed protein product [Pleuronectes platessa]